MSKKNADYLARLAAGRSVAQIEVNDANVDELLRDSGYDLPEGYTRRERDAALAHLVAVLVFMTGRDSRVAALIKQAGHIFESPGEPER